MKPLRSIFETPEELQRPSLSETVRMIDDAVRAIICAEYAEIERVCRRAVEEGKHGVRIDRVDGKLIRVAIDPRVPPNTIHEYLGREPGMFDDVLRAQAALLDDRWYR